MAWETDKPPIDYLKQRIKYYKKKRGVVRRLIKDPFAITRYGGEEKLQELIDSRLEEIDTLMGMYEDAVLNLETIEEVEARVDNHKSFKNQ